MCFDRQALLFRYRYLWIPRCQKDLKNRLSVWFKNHGSMWSFQMPARRLDCSATSCKVWWLVLLFVHPNLDVQQPHMNFKTSLRISHQNTGAQDPDPARFVLEPCSNSGCFMLVFCVSQFCRCFHFLSVLVSEGDAECCNTLELRLESCRIVCDFVGYSGPCVVV